MTTLRQVLQLFEQRQRLVALPALAEELGISEIMLGEMIEFWVRKGRLREVNSVCATCHCGCSSKIKTAKCYELVSVKSVAGN